MEAEFIAFASVVQEVIWLSRFLHNTGVAHFFQSSNSLLWQSSHNSLYQNPKYHCKTKHIDINYKFVRDIVQRKLVMKYISVH